MILFRFTQIGRDDLECQTSNLFIVLCLIFIVLFYFNQMKEGVNIFCHSSDALPTMLGTKRRDIFNFHFSQ